MSNRAVFLDRDGTLIEHYDYLTDPDQVKLLPTVAKAMGLLKDRDFKLVVVTNQSAIARGMLTEKKLLEIHDRLKYLLAEEGAYLDQIYYCPYHPEGVVDKYRRDSDMRKPAPGMLYLAARELDLDLEQCWIVGDDDRDIEAGKQAKCRTVFIKPHHSPLVQRGSATPDFQAVNLQEAANQIIRYADDRAGIEEEAEEEKRRQEQAEAASRKVVEEEKPASKVVEAPVPKEDSKSSASSVGGEGVADSVKTEVTAKSEVSEPAPPTFLRPDVITTARRKKPVLDDGEDSYPVEEDGPVLPKEIVAVHQETKQVRNHEIARHKTSKKRKPAVRDGAIEGSRDTQDILTQILRELKALNRQSTFSEFSISKLIAGIIQMLVFMCLIGAIWFISAQEPDPEKAQLVLLMGLVFQTLTLTLLTLRK
ncbi:MAG: HAD family hydrolase [Planctomycetes bacterium]|nr:HAD family hydrolase [Planctomycetota bacterium]